LLDPVSHNCDSGNRFSGTGYVIDDTPIPVLYPTADCGFLMRLELPAWDLSNRNRTVSGGRACVGATLDCEPNVSSGVVDSSIIRYTQQLLPSGFREVTHDNSVSEVRPQGVKFRAVSSDSLGFNGPLPRSEDLEALMIRAHVPR
jgi:hypothetical protein